MFWLGRQFLQNSRRFKKMSSGISRKAIQGVLWCRASRLAKLSRLKPGHKQNKTKSLQKVKW